MLSNGFVAVAVVSVDRKGSVVPWLVGYPNQTVIRASRDQMKSLKKEGVMAGCLADGSWAEVFVDKIGDSKMLTVEKTDEALSDSVLAWLTKQGRQW